MTDSLTPENYLSFLLGDLKSLCDFAYEHGFHEMGYDPVSEISAFATKAVEELHDRARNRTVAG